MTLVATPADADANSYLTVADADALAGDDIDRIEFDGTGNGASSGGFDPQPRDDSGGGTGWLEPAG